MTGLFVALGGLILMAVAVMEYFNGDRGYNDWMIAWAKGIAGLCFFVHGCYLVYVFIETHP